MSKKWAASMNFRTKEPVTLKIITVTINLILFDQISISFVYEHSILYHFEVINKIPAIVVQSIEKCSYILG